MNNDEKFIELLAHFIIQRRDKKFLTKVKPYLILFLVSSFLVLAVKPRPIIGLLYLALLITTIIITVVIFISAKKESDQEFEKLCETLKNSEDKEITQTEFLYNIWKGESL